MSFIFPLLYFFEVLFFSNAIKIYNFSKNINQKSICENGWKRRLKKQTTGKLINKNHFKKLIYLRLVFEWFHSCNNFFEKSGHMQRKCVDDDFIFFHFYYTYFSFLQSISMQTRRSHCKDWIIFQKLLIKLIIECITASCLMIPFAQFQVFVVTSQYFFKKIISSFMVQFSIDDFIFQNVHWRFT